MILAHDKKEEGLKEFIDRIKSVFNILAGYILGLDIEEFIQSKK